MQVKVCNSDSPQFKNDFLDSVTNTGFAVLVNHGIKADDIYAAQTQWRRYFTKPPVYKYAFINEKDPNMGYKEFRSEKAVGFEKADLKEFFHWKPGQHIPAPLKATANLMFSELNSLGLKLLSILPSEKSDNFYHDACVGSDNTILRTLYYPAMDFSTQPGAVRAAAHEDINFITLLVAASAPGLQVKDAQGVWYDVPHEENSITVNIGDMIQLASCGLYKSTTHQVINPDNNTTDRISMPLFIHPRSDTILAPGITAQQFLNERLAQIYQGNK